MIDVEVRLTRLRAFAMLARVHAVRTTGDKIDRRAIPRDARHEPEHPAAGSQIRGMSSCQRRCRPVLRTRYRSPPTVKNTRVLVTARRLEFLALAPPSSTVSSRTMSRKIDALSLPADQTTREPSVESRSSLSRTCRDGRSSALPRAPVPSGSTLTKLKLPISPLVQTPVRRTFCESNPPGTQDDMAPVGLAPAKRGPHSTVLPVDTALTPNSVPSGTFATPGAPVTSGR